MSVPYAELYRVCFTLKLVQAVRCNWFICTPGHITKWNQYTLMCDGKYLAARHFSKSTVTTESPTPFFSQLQQAALLHLFITSWMIPSESIKLNRPTGSQILTGLHDLSDHLSCSIAVQGPDCHHAVVLWVSMAFQLIILTSLLLLYSFHQVCFVF